MSGKLLQEKPVFIKTALQENSEERLLDRLELLPTQRRYQNLLKPLTRQ